VIKRGDVFYYNYSSGGDSFTAIDGRAVVAATDAAKDGSVYFFLPEQIQAGATEDQRYWATENEVGLLLQVPM
jgi:hypothetical protein